VRSQRADAPRDIADHTAQLARARAVARGEDAAAADMELCPGVVHSDSRRQSQRSATVLNVWEDLGQQKWCVGITECVVLHVPVLGAGSMNTPMVTGISPRWMRMIGNVT